MFCCFRKLSYSLLMVFLGLTAVCRTATAQKQGGWPIPEWIAYEGRPDGTLVGLSSRYYVFADQRGWNVVTVTDRGQKKFRGRIEVDKGQIKAVVPYGREKVADLIRGDSSRKFFDFEFATSTKADGFYFKVSPDVEHIKFSLLHPNGSYDKDIVFVGSERQNPLRSPFSIDVKRSSRAKKLQAATNLIADLDLNPYVVRGSASHRAQTLVLKRIVNGASQVVLPVDPTSNYDLEAEFNRTAGAKQLFIGLLVGGRPCSIILDGYAKLGYRSGLQKIDNQLVVSDLNPTRRDGKLLENGRKGRLLIQVRSPNTNASSVEVSLDGESIISWRGSPEQLSRRSFFDVPMSSCFYVASFDAAYTISRIEFRPVSQLDQ